MGLIVPAAMITIGRCSLSRGASPIAVAAPRSRTENCPLQTAYINRVATAVPPYDVHDAFRRFAQSRLNDDRRNSLLFQRMAGKSGIEHRYSCLAPSNLPESDRVGAQGFYPGGDFPDTAARMRRFEQHAPALAQAPVDCLQLGAECDRITHLSAALAVEHIRLRRPPDAYLAAARQLTAIPIRLASIVSGLARSSGAT